MVRRLQAAVVGGNPAATIMQREGVNDHKSNRPANKSQVKKSKKQKICNVAKLGTAK